jgi:hypothetical protein
MVVRLCNFYADDPQSWFFTINSIFETSRVTRSVTKFHWAIGKLPPSIAPSIAHLCRNVNQLADPYGELRTLIVSSYGLSHEQRIDRLIDFPSLGGQRPSVLWDQMNAIRPDSVDDIMRVFFFRRMPGYIRDVVNTRKWDNFHDLTQLCNQIWEQRGGAAAAMAAAVQPRAASPKGGRSRSPAPAPKTAQKQKNQHRRSPTPAAARTYPDSAGRCFYHSSYGDETRKCRDPCTYQEN